MPNDQLDLSFIIPTHDRTELLAETIESVLNQTLRPKEIIVVDNGVEDRAAATLAPFGDKVRLVKSTPHIVQIARNVGISLASTDWIATLDDDDLLTPDYLAEMAKPMRDGRADIISSDHRKFRGSLHDMKTNFEKAPPGYWNDIPLPRSGEIWSFVGKFPLDRLLKRVPVYPSTMIIRRNFALEIGGYNPQMLGIKSEDLEFLIRALTYGHLSLVWKPLVHYRLHPGNDSASADSKEIGRWRIFEFARQNHPDLPPYFKESLELDMLERRRRVYATAHRLGDEKVTRELRGVLRTCDAVELYKQAYRNGDRSLMQNLASLIPPDRWSLGLRARQLFSSTHAPVVLRSVRKMLSKLKTR